MDYYESCGCTHSRSKMCPLHQYMWETHCAAARMMENPPKLTPWQEVQRWWYCYNPFGVKEEFWWTLVFWLVILRLIFG